LILQALETHLGFWLNISNQNMNQKPSTKFRLFEHKCQESRDFYAIDFKKVGKKTDLYESVQILSRIFKITAHFGLQPNF